MTRAAIYLRISQDATGEGLGVSRQLEDCAALAESQGWEVAEVYQDNDISAASGKPRPAYNKLLRDMQDGQIDAVICWHADRLYRRMRDLEELVQIVRATSTQIATVKAGKIDLTTDAGQMLAEILASVASYEGRAKATRWKRSWQQGREQGRPAKTGTRLYGYTHEGELIPEEAAVARGIAEDILAGVALQAICRRLEAEGVQTTRGSVWRTGTLRQYVLNPRIAGHSTLKGDIVAAGLWEPILDSDTWETIRALLTSRARETPPRVSVLVGYIYCGKCGHRLITGKARKGRTYRCPSPGRVGMDGCGRVSSYAGPVEEIVETYARQRLSNPSVLRRAAELRSGAGAGELLAEIAALEARSAELEAELDTPGVPVAAITRAMDRTRERLEKAQANLAAVAQATVPVVNTGGLDWPEDLAQRRKLVAVALGEKRVYLDPVGKVHNYFDPSRVRID